MNTVEVLKNFFVQTGSGFVLWLLFALSVGSIAIAIERLWFLRKKTCDLKDLVKSIDSELRTGRVEAALGSSETLRRWV